MFVRLFICFYSIFLFREKIFRYFRMAEAGEEGEWMAPAEILKILHQEVDIPLNAKRVAAFGRILRKQGIPSRHTRKGTVYQLVRA